tara:strand:- start:36 stop:575 length:540 start_codon:yes stop_codon:yes gene_type:complete
MSITTLVSFIRVKDSTGTVQDLYQNGRKDGTNSLDDGSGKYRQDASNSIQLDGENYYYLPFLYQGATKNRSGDNLEAALVFANNPLAMNRAREAVVNRWSIEVFVCRVDPKDDMKPITTYGSPYLTQDVWLAASMGYDPTTIEVLLSSGIDAVGSNAPNRVLTTSLVGHLPTTGQIQNR